jgi:hypothetical protein
MTRAYAIWKVYWALWLLCLFGALCFATGVAAATAMAVAMLRVMS